MYRRKLERSSHDSTGDRNIMKRLTCLKDELEFAALLVDAFQMIGNPPVQRAGTDGSADPIVWSYLTGAKSTVVLSAGRKNADQGGNSMSKVLALVGASVGGWLGWWLGGLVGGTTAFVLSIVGTAGGVYYGRRVARQYLE
jgi:hypothetical protein